ncbi:MAG: branched-chain amino acid aminotransferase, partial [Limisphaerales bacterium]
MNEPIAYLKGEFIPQSEAKLPVYDAGVVLGATVTEMIRTFAGQPYKLEEHVARLFRSMRYARFDTEMTPEAMLAAALKVIENNKTKLPPGKELGIVLFVTAGEFSIYAGSAGHGDKMIPTVCIHTFP